MRVLLTGMSGTGKSTVVHELRRRGFAAYDADDDGYSEPRADGRWGWRSELVAQLLATASDGVLFFAGCSDEQGQFGFDLTVLLTAPVAVIEARLATRTTNTYGQAPEELAQVMADLAEIEPLLHRSADLVLDTTQPVEQIADAILKEVDG